MIDLSKITAAMSAPGGLDSASFIPPPPPAPPTRQGQREIVAATLAAGIIAADHTRPATVENAVALMREIMAAAWAEK